MANLSRRSLMARVGAGALAAMAEGPARAGGRRFFESAGLPIGLQLYTLGGALQTDLDGLLGQVAKIGYQTVELAGLLGRTPAQMRAAFDKAGLRCTSAHIPGHASPPDLSLDGDIGALIDSAHVIGFSHVVMPMLVIPDHVVKQLASEAPGARFGRVGALLTRDDWKSTADFLNAKGAPLKAAGLQLAYHNHNLEFAPVGDSTGLEILLRHTDPDLVQFEMDVGWVVAGGGDPIALIKAHPHRFHMMHVKDVKSTTKTNYAFQQDPADIGSGIIDWRRILPVAYAAGFRDFFVEQEPPFDKPRIESAKIDFDYLNNLVV